MATPKRAAHQPISEKERARTQALFKSIGDGIVATDEHGIISEINSQALKILGYSEKELLGKWFPRAIQAMDDEEREMDLMDRPVVQAMLTGKSISGKTLYRTKHGETVPVAITISPILLDGRPIGAIEVFRDISQEHEVDRMKSEFISIASHQLRTPLTAIKTYSHMLASGFGGKLTTAQKDFMGIILGSIDRMNELINTLLDISRIEEGRLAIEHQFVDLELVIEEIITELQPFADAKKVSVTLQYESDDLNAITDPLLIREVCANLLSNAIKYTPTGGAVTVTFDADDKYFIFTVADNGYGIPRREQKRIFTKFFRAENILNKETSGTGLGLYLVKQIAESLGGSVSFKSVEGEGSRFQFKLPRYETAIKN